MQNLFFILGVAISSFQIQAFAADLKVGDPAPVFQAKTDQNKDFTLSSRKGQWTVLYFYPKAGTPGCTTQAQTFRDQIAPIRSAGAEVYGISTDTVADQAQFNQDQKLNLTLLADPDAKVTQLYGSKMPMLNVSKRWTFIIDPDLKIRSLDQNVDPAQDPGKVAAKLAELKNSSTGTSKTKK
jgi:peroxiredoxin Q/BCP